MDTQGLDLQTIEEIRALKYRYLRAVDLKLWDELAGTLCVDVVADYGSPSGGGRCSRRSPPRTRVGS